MESEVCDRLPGADLTVLPQVPYTFLNRTCGTAGKECCLSFVQQHSCPYDAVVQVPSRVVLAADHAGFPLKEAVKTHCQAKGMDILDVGTFSGDPVDYPAIMRRGAAVVLEQGCPGLFFGGSGNGEAMAANKVRGIRAALVYSPESARLARAHNDANVACFGARLTPEHVALECVDIFLTTPFDGGRHEGRVKDLEP